LPSRRWNAGVKARSSSPAAWPKEALLIPTPILTVLSTFQKNGVQTLLMGGQACVFYGAAQVSKDVDLAVLAEPANIQRLRCALRDLF